MVRNGPPELARVRSVQFTNSHVEWSVYYQDFVRWFPTWAEAYGYAYTITRLRNVVVDALMHVDDDTVSFDKWDLDEWGVS